MEKLENMEIHSYNGMEYQITATDYANGDAESDWIIQFIMDGSKHIATTKTFVGGIDGKSKCSLNRFLSEIVNCWGGTPLYVAKVEFPSLSETDNMGDF